MSNPVFELYNIFSFDKGIKVPKGLVLYDDGSLYKAKRFFNRNDLDDENVIQKDRLIFKSIKIVQKVQQILFSYKKEINILPKIIDPPCLFVDGQEEFIRLDKKIVFGFNALCALPYDGNNVYQKLITENYNEEEPFFVFTKILKEIQEVIGDFGQYLFTEKRIKTAFRIDDKELLKSYLARYNYFKGYPLFHLKSEEEKIIFSMGEHYISEKRIFFKGNPFCCILPFDNLGSYITDNMISLYIAFDKNRIAWCDTLLPEKEKRKKLDLFFFVAQEIIIEEDEE